MGPPAVPGGPPADPPVCGGGVQLTYSPGLHCGVGGGADPQAVPTHPVAGGGPPAVPPVAAVP